jgi:3-hydroxyisobutyrate dehydrogenase
MNLGFIGLGNIGGAIAANLARDGHALRAFDRDAARRDGAAAHGAIACGDVREVAAASEITFLSLPTPDVVDAVAGEWLEAAPDAAVLVDLSTNAPQRVRALGDRIAARGRHFLDAPLSGGAPGAQARMLMFMVGGEPEVFARVRPVFEKIGRAAFHLGPVGSGSVAKLVNSLVAFSTTMASLEGLSLAVRCGLDLRRMVEVVRTGGAGNFYTDRAVEGIERRSEVPQFALELAAKDARLILALEQERGLPGRIASSLAKLLEDACAAGMAQKDWTDLPAFFEREGGLRLALAPADGSAADRA